MVTVALAEWEPVNPQYLLARARTLPLNTLGPESPPQFKALGDSKDRFLTRIGYVDPLPASAYWIHASCDPVVVPHQDGVLSAYLLELGMATSGKLAGESSVPSSGTHIVLAMFRSERPIFGNFYFAHTEDGDIPYYDERVQPLAADTFYDSARTFPYRSGYLDTSLTLRLGYEYADEATGNCTVIWANTFSATRADSNYHRNVGMYTTNLIEQHLHEQSIP